MAGWFGIGVALWGLPIALISVFPTLTAALCLPACVGIGNALLDLGASRASPKSSETGRLVATLGQAQGFGEIALLRRVPRTATVRAASQLQLRALASDHSLPAVTGFTPSARETGASVDTLLDRFAPCDRAEELNFPEDNVDGR